ncbi:MAG: proprotein convertase P-domain-containing protein [Chitinophagaceae bacterium]|nr:proprotein convertase P-domain-containing protein [Chitinophagaceae bacterium]
MKKIFMLMVLQLFVVFAYTQTIAVSEIEPNNGFASATPITTNPAKIYGNVFPNADEDWYSFSATAGDRVYAGVITSSSSSGSTDSRLWLYASDGTTILEFDDDGGVFAGLSSTIAGAVIPATGTYYLRITHFSLTSQLRGYNLYVRLQSGSPVPETEANDTPGTANIMPAGGWVSGTRDPALATEQDWFSVTLAAGETVFISMDLDPERDNVQYNGRLGFALFGDANNQILVIDDASTGSVADPLSECMVFTAKDAGTYYVFADAASAATGGPTATYHISFSKFAATPGYVNYPSADIPKTIGPGTGSVTSTLNIPDSKLIKDISIRLNLNHALMADIDATLTSPNGNVIALFTDIGATVTGGQNQMDLLLNDNNAIPPLYTVLRPVGFQPEFANKLNLFKGMNTAGTWTLTLYDDVANASGGTLNSWSIDILEEVPPNITGAVTIANEDFETTDGGFTHSGTQDEWERGTPAFAPITTANSGVSCWKTDLDNTYNASSNQILESQTYNLAAVTGPIYLSWAMKYQVESTSFDQFRVYVEEVGNPANTRVLFEWMGASKPQSVGNPSTSQPVSAGWGTHWADISSFAGLQIRFKVSLVTDPSVQHVGVAIDDFKMYNIAACTPSSITLGASPVTCIGTTTANLPYTATTGSPNIYSIDYDAAAEAAGFTDVVNAALPASPIVLTVPGAAPVAVYNAGITVQNSVGGCVSPVVPFTITVISSPAMTPVANDTVCNNSLAGPYNFTSVPPGATFTWTNSNVAIGLAAAGAGNIPAFNATNATAAPINATITVTPTVGTCVGTPISFIIRVNPSGQVNAIANQQLCRGASTAAVNFTTTVPGTVFSWSNDNTLIGLAATGQGNIPSFIAQNPTGVPQVATITVTPTYGSGGIQVTQNFSYTGAVQTFVVPAGVTSINVKAWGAQGNSNAQSTAIGGLGGYAEGTLAVTPGQTLYINAGGGGITSVSGGFNGGGAAGANAGCAQARGGGGGGATDVRVGANTLGARAIVAAGGGGGGGNRLAGCGRGTGGGGGGGLWGGGGGAGWPGVPGSQGPVPTGGTQAAGGAGGVTTSTAGATNGLPGVLGIGGAGGIEIGSNQGGSAVAQPGGIGGGLTGGSGLYNQANNWTGQSGAGGSSYIGGVSAGVTNAGVNTGNGRVEFSFAAGGLACAGTPRTFTITVNPNQDLIIVADPGTTICNGDPTLLTVYNVGASSAPGNLHIQPGPGTNGSPSQVFEPANAAFSSQAADDFTVPGGATWTVTRLDVVGTNTGSGVPTSVNVFFYANSGSNLPGAAIASYTNLASFVRTGGNYAVTLPGAGINLSAGTYWVSFQVNMSFATSGQWFWSNYGATNIGNQYAWQNPGGGFATPCTNWGYGATGCAVGGGVNRNNIFTIFGSSVTPGTIATGTFLWSPAAGLSSTTSNPVAASPMNTTTYTVVRTTVPGGCVASAQVTVTVNQRPTVTTQPASSTNCVGNTVTFTVAGTGTGLAYQWQVRPTGCGGPWTNLPNTAPYSGVNTGTLTVTPVTQLLSGYAYRAVLTGACAPIGTANISNCVILTVNPNPVVNITPAGPVCGGVAGINGTLLSAATAAPPVPGQASANSGTINVPIPDGTGVAATSNLTIAGIPANATITEIKVNMNINHTWVGDVDVNLRAPNNAILNLVGGLDGGTGGNSTDNFTNTAFSSIGGATISGAPAPRTGTFAAEARAGFGPIGYTQTVATWAGLVPPATPTAANGQWTLAMGDFVGTDIGALTNWSITIDYTTPGGGGGPTLTYVWSPQAGLYTNATATTPYTGGNTPNVYAAPTAQTLYTVRATDVATGCFTDATVLVNYTPPAPTVVPSSVTMCLGDPAVKLKSSSSQAFSSTFNSGTLALAIPDGPASWPQTVFPGVVTPNLPVSGIPANATITGMSVKLNLTHTYIADMVIVLKAPNGQVFNLDANINKTGGAGANFINTIISSASTTPLSAGAPPYTGTFRADAVGATYVAVGFTFPGGPTSPAGYIPTVTNFNGLYSVPNGNWTLGMYDWGLGDLGTLTNWELKFDYIIGVPATPAVWSPAAGLFSDAAAAVPYVAGTAVDSVWTRPTPAGVYTYQATVQNLITTAATVNTPMAGGNGNNLVAFNVRNNNPYPVTFASIASNTFGSRCSCFEGILQTYPDCRCSGCHQCSQWMDTIWYCQQ